MGPVSNSKNITRGLLALALVSLLILAWTQRDKFVPVGAGSRAPQYSARTLDGKLVALESLRGKVVVLNVWATWCTPCLTEMPALERLHRSLHGRGLEVVAVSVDAPFGTIGSGGQKGGDVRAYVQDLNLTFTVLHDQDRKIEQLFLVQGLPTTFIIDKQGRIDQKVVGARAWDDANYIKYFNDLLSM